jgi:hypothetical protein
MICINNVLRFIKQFVMIFIDNLFGTFVYNKTEKAAIL